MQPLGPAWKAIETRSLNVCSPVPRFSYRTMPIGTTSQHFWTERRRTGAYAPASAFESSWMNWAERMQRGGKMNSKNPETSRFWIWRAPTSAPPIFSSCWTAAPSWVCSASRANRDFWRCSTSSVWCKATRTYSAWTIPEMRRAIGSRRRASVRAYATNLSSSPD